MCNEAARRISLDLLRDDWSQLKVPLVFPEGLPNLAPLDSIRITDPTFILRANSEGEGVEQGPPQSTTLRGVEGVTRRWSWPAPGGKPVYNFRSEGRAFTNGDTAGRCLIPVDAFFEFTDPPPDLLGTAPKRARKDKWRFTHADDAWFCIAGWWRTEPALGEGRAGQAFTMLTCEPGPDIAPYHRRQIVLPPRQQWAGWLDGSLPASEVCRPTPAGTLTVERAG